MRTVIGIETVERAFKYVIDPFRKSVFIIITASEKFLIRVARSVRTLCLPGNLFSLSV